ncbi:hypothetical protein KM043_007385 [Ampulex compressa]|nr:hypothetical protein KM043_007385 [Ampulex compressa]
MYERPSSSDSPRYSNVLSNPVYPRSVRDTRERRVDDGAADRPEPRRARKDPAVDDARFHSRRGKSTETKQGGKVSGPPSAKGASPKTRSFRPTDGSVCTRPSPVLLLVVGPFRQSPLKAIALFRSREERRVAADIARATSVKYVDRARRDGIGANELCQQDTPSKAKRRGVARWRPKEESAEKGAAGGEE